ncbi:MAG: FG-GAP-like repeat-containing protein [Candidatus Cloacimonetes bacterium]|jgi:hypothetical protein|nr:FG-GAP-like repeat-containing protein [Candidatus Cloacimonadota bacterium]MDD2506625.1 FG-GAP-like repeat-containing protein [Candidatus Cloacimonadota bacterium]MDD4148297.1 FG-GAP-like repeat-containing protein [Candidatus Cloacimonadota bacterium]MDD4560244.1 FG-GAP-like repeat-containing protein [Candidatus Cloacimonadota bacterium]
MTKTSVVIALLMFLSTISAQPWTMDNSIFNPSGIPSLTFSQVRFNDIDEDGDCDIWLGNTSRPPVFLENTGSISEPVYIVGTDYLSGLSYLTCEVTISADLNGDGILDLVTGGFSGLFYYLGQDADTPSYVEVPSFFAGLNLSPYPVPDLADVDGDGDLDLLIGLSEDGAVRLYMNTGSATEPQFSDSFELVSDIGLYAYPVFCDFDGDADIDIFCGRDLHGFVYFQNNGSPTNPLWEENSALFSGLGNETYWNSGDLSDINGDGLLDLVYGTADGPLKCFVNNGSATVPLWQENTSLFGGSIDVGGASSPFFIDFDADGDFDMLTGTQLGYIKYFRNVGDIYNPAWEEDSDFFSSIDHSIYSSVAAADVTGDDLPDLVVGDLSGGLFYYNNLGVSLFYNSFMFMGINYGGWSCPRFVDLDTDGDWDIVVGNEDGNLHYLKNEGSPIAPNWQEQPGFFGSIDVSSSCSPTFADIDGDGDLDLLAGSSWGELYCYLYDESIWVPNSTIFSGIETDQNAAPALVDLDHDGDLDLILGDYDGTFKFFRNELYSAEVLNPPLNIGYEYTEMHMIFWDDPMEGSTSPFELYNVYLDGCLVASTPDNFYFFEELDPGTHLVGVAAQYIAGESLPVQMSITASDNHDLLNSPILLTNYPNPFNPNTTIQFSFPSGDARLEIYNIKGQLIRQFSGLNSADKHIVWDGKDENGRPQSSGVYFYRLHNNRKSAMNKMLLLK